MGLLLILILIRLRLYLIKSFSMTDQEYRAMRQNARVTAEMNFNCKNYSALLENLFNRIFSGGNI